MALSRLPTCADTIWSGWYTSATFSTASTGDTTDPWGFWQQIQQAQQPFDAVAYNERAVAEQRRAEAEYARLREGQLQKQDAARRRSFELLESFLTPEQRETLKRHRFFLVKAPSGRLYRINEGSHGNVEVLDPRTRGWVERLCIQPNGVPPGDSMLMQKVMIETNEEAFRAHANITLADGRKLLGRPELLTHERALEFLPRAAA